LEKGKRMRTGFIGLGSQGGPMARRMIDAGYPTTLWARRAEALDPYRDTDAAYAASIGEVGAKADHVGVCVLDDAGVRDVCGELIASMRPGGRIAVHSTVHPATCIALAEQATVHGIALIDAPVSGGGPGAAAGTLTLMLGGEEDAIAAARPVFKTFAGTIIRLGGVGAAQTAKLVNNSLMAAHVALAHHALNAGAALGIDRQAFVDLIKVSSGRSFGFEVAARMSSPSSFAHGAKLLAKDVRLLGELLGDDPAFAAFDQLASPFLALAQA
jgi:3-hydroxyisobutyrate dehydrogenase-like beta-hydroxyacid dehydrogenase